MEIILKKTKRPGKLKLCWFYSFSVFFFLFFSFREASCNLLFCHCLGINKISKERSLRVPSNCRPSILTTVRDFKNTLRKFCIRIHVIFPALGQGGFPKTFSIYFPQFFGLWRSDPIFGLWLALKLMILFRMLWFLTSPLAGLCSCQSRWNILPLFTGLLQCTALAREKSKWNEKYKQVKHNWLAGKCTLVSWDFKIRFSSVLSCAVGHFICSWVSLSQVFVSLWEQAELCEDTNLVWELSSLTRCSAWANKAYFD